MVVCSYLSGAFFQENYLQLQSLKVVIIVAELPSSFQRVSCHLLEQSPLFAEGIKLCRFQNPTDGISFPVHWFLVVVENIAPLEYSSAWSFSTVVGQGNCLGEMYCLPGLGLPIGNALTPIIISSGPFRLSLFYLLFITPKARVKSYFGLFGGPLPPFAISF